MAERRINPFQPSTSPWDDSFTATGSRGTIIFPSAVPPNASPIVPIVKQVSFNVAGVNSPPAMPSFWDATAIQLTMAGANGGTTWVDQKFAVTPATSASCTTSISQYLFWGSSTFVDGNTGSNRGLQFTDAAQYALGANDFTIEGWFWADQSDVLLRQFTCLASQGNNTTAAGNWGIYLNIASATDGKVQFSAYPGITLLGTTKNNNAKWHHVAVCRAGILWSLYIDGRLEASTSASVNLADRTEPLCFGGGNGFTVALRGYLSEWRIVNGVCVYTGASFAVPTVPFPTT